MALGYSKEAGGEAPLNKSSIQICQTVSVFKNFLRGGDFSSPLSESHGCRPQSVFSRAILLNALDAHGLLFRRSRALEFHFVDLLLLYFCESAVQDLVFFARR